MNTHNQPTPTTDYRTATRQRLAALAVERMKLQQANDAYTLHAAAVPEPEQAGPNVAVGCVAALMLAGFAGLGVVTLAAIYFGLREGGLWSGVAAFGGAGLVLLFAAMVQGERR